MAEWVVLQRKIFTRWVNQRLKTRQLPGVDDIVNDLRKGRTLMDLVEILSERPCPYKFNASARFKAQELENIDNGLKFIWDCGVQVSLKPSPENIYEQDERLILGLIWALMLKYLKFAQEDEENLSPKDALMRWVNLNVSNYPGAEVKNFTSSFHNGITLCALIHKFKPELINFNGLSPANHFENLQTAMDAAEQFFGLEKYLNPSDIAKLDEKSMLVYVSEYYSGITEQLKLDLAARRLTQLVEFTMVNDDLKAQYEREAEACSKHINEAILALEGLAPGRVHSLDKVQALIKQFSDFLGNEKRTIFAEHIKLEATLNNLASRLADNNRPQYKASKPELLPESRAASLQKLQQTEKEVGLKLNSEKSRLLQLQHLDQQHQQRTVKLNEWIVDRKARLPSPSDVKSSGQARNLLQFLESTKSETQKQKDVNLAALGSLRTRLEDGEYENLPHVQHRETEVEAKVSQFVDTVDSLFPPFEDALKRETFKEEVERKTTVHADMVEQIKTWYEGKRTHLEAKEDISAVSAAQLALGQLDTTVKEVDDEESGRGANLKRLGAEICESSYTSELSSWRFDRPNEIKERHSQVDTWLGELRRLAAQKRVILDDDLKRELYAEETRSLARQHADRWNQLMAVANDKANYLRKREPCESLDTASFLLGVYEAFLKELDSLTKADKRSLEELADTIRQRKYQTELSSYTYESPEQLDERHSRLDNMWTELSSLSSDKKAVLDDHHARCLYQNKVRLWCRSHQDLFLRIEAWWEAKKAYLDTKEDISSVQQAQLQLSILAAFRQELADMKKGSGNALVQLGNDIRSAEYKTEHSQWKYEKPEEVSGLETKVEEYWTQLEGLADSKELVLQDDLAREQFKEKVRLWVRNHREMYEGICNWHGQRLAYLETKEEVHSSEQAKVQLSLLDAFYTEKSGMEQGSVSALEKLGQEIRDAEYATSYSRWVYEDPSGVESLEKRVRGELLVSLEDAGATKRAVLEDDLARELYAEETRLMAGQHEKSQGILMEWVAIKRAYLQERPEVESTVDADFHLSVLDSFRAAKQAATETSVASLLQLGQSILERKYASELSSYMFEDPDNVKAREAAVSDAWNSLDQLAGEKQQILQDHRERNAFKEKVLSWVSIHSDMFSKVQDWVGERTSFLEERDSIESTHEARTHLGLLRQFQQEVQDRKSGLIAALKMLGNDIRSAKYSSSRSEWAYDKPSEVTDLEGMIDAFLSELEDCRISKDEYLQDALKRNECKEKVLLLAGRHRDMFEMLSSWADRCRELLSKEPSISSIDDAFVAQSILATLEAQIQTAKSAAAPSLTELGEQVLSTTYESKLSSWSYPEADTINERSAMLAGVLNDLESRCQARHKVLSDAMQRETEKDKLHAEFANEINALQAFVKDTAILMGSLDDNKGRFGLTIDETEKFEATLKQEDESLRQQVKQRKAACSGVLSKLSTTFGQTSNPYTEHDTRSLDSFEKELEDALATRRSIYQQEMARQQANDQLCKSYANVVEPLADKLTSNMHQLAEPKGTLEDQLRDVEQALSGLAATENSLSEAAKVDEEIRQHQIAFNPHTTITTEDIEQQIADFRRILEMKKPLLEQEISFKKSRGVTPEQIQEFVDFFQQFDKDKSGSIERRELKACLFSLGEELTTAQVEEYMKRFGGRDKLSKDQFVQLMVHLTGILHTQESILASFKLLGESDTHVPLEPLSKRMKPAHVDFIRTTGPMDKDGLDYLKFTQTVFAR